MMTSIKSLISQLYKDTQIRVIQANTTAPTPPLPFGIYNVISSYIKDAGREDITTYEDETGLYLKRSEQYQVTLSFSFYSNTTETTIDQANKVRQWFLFLGQEFIEEQNIAVVEVGNTENRTTFLVDSYEYKHGFDVRLRLSTEQSRLIDWVETVTIEEMKTLWSELMEQGYTWEELKDYTWEELKILL